MNIFNTILRKTTLNKFNTIKLLKRKNEKSTNTASAAMTLATEQPTVCQITMDVEVS